MTPSEIQEAYARANEVLHGFKKPSELNARDVIALVKHINGLKESQPFRTEQKNDSDFQAVKDLFGL